MQFVFFGFKIVQTLILFGLKLNYLPAQFNSRHSTSLITLNLKFNSLLSGCTGLKQGRSVSVTHVVISSHQAEQWPEAYKISPEFLILKIPFTRPKMGFVS